MSQVRKSDIQDISNKIRNTDQYGPDPSSEESSIKQLLKDNMFINQMITVRQSHQSKAIAAFRHTNALDNLRGLLTREYTYETDIYKINKHMANLITDMGFVLADSDLPQTDNVKQTKFHRLIKQTPDHLIVVTYEIRKRLICPPNPQDNPEYIRSTTEKSFGYFMKKHGFVPPNLMGKDFDDDAVLKEEMEARSSKDLEKAFDDTDDKTNFEIAIVNRANQALCIDAMV
jgi:hypothetical protein